MLRSPKIFNKPKKDQLGPPGVITAHSGLYNLSNTCYFNATMQALSHLPTLDIRFLSAQETAPVGSFDSLPPKNPQKKSQAIFNGKYFKTAQNNLILSFYKFIGELQASGKSAIDPSEFYYNFLSEFTFFIHGEQQDSHEMFILLMAYMIEEEPKESFSHYSFNGKLRLNTECGKCKLSLDNPQQFTALTLGITESIQSSINDYLSKKASSIDGDYRCERCQCTSTAVYNVRITVWPVVLCIHLNRAMLKKKILSTGIKAAKNTDSIAIEDIITLSGKTYYLMSTVHHVGSSLSSGHYYSFGNSCEGWKMYNDNTVKASTPFNDTNTVYMLFYIRHDVYDKIVSTLKK